MFFDFEKYCYYVAPGGTDMRKGSESLSRLAQETLKLNPLSKSMFLFCNRSHKTLAVLVWDNGFWLMKKKLNEGTFAWPSTASEALKITVEDVKRVIRGDDVFRRIKVLPNDLEI